MVFALALLVFVLTFDQNNLTRSFYRPIVSATLTGALLGNIAAGAMVGSSFELFLIAFEQTGVSAFATDGYFLGAIAAAILACTEGLDTSTAISTGAIIGLVAAVIHGAITWLATLLLPGARNAAEKGNGKKLGLFNIMPLVLEAVIYAVIAVLIDQNGSTIISSITESYQSGWGWIFVGLAFAAKLSPAIGISVLARNLKANDYVGALLAGGATMAVLISVNSDTALLLSVAAAFAIAAYDFHTHISQPVSAKPEISEKSSMKRILLEKEGKEGKKEPVKVAIKEKKEVRETKPVIEEKVVIKENLEKEPAEKQVVKAAPAVREKEAEPEKQKAVPSQTEPEKVDEKAEENPVEKTEEDIKKERAEKQKRMEEESQVKGDDEVWW